MARARGDILDITCLCPYCFCSCTQKSIEKIQSSKIEKVVTIWTRKIQEIWGSGGLAPPPPPQIQINNDKFVLVPFSQYLEYVIHKMFHWIIVHISMICYFSPFTWSWLTPFDIQSSICPRFSLPSQALCTSAFFVVFFFYLGCWKSEVDRLFVCA